MKIVDRKRCCIVLVVYKPLDQYDENEQQAFRNLLQVFFNRDFYIVCPRPLVEEYAQYAPCIALEVSRLSYADYNILCKSVGFYQTFLDLGYRYMCLVQLDVWVFQDNLEYFLNQFDERGYDYIGAPWYGVHFCKDGVVGNGGFCIRKLETFRNICRDYPLRGGNEDVFFLQEHGDKIKVASTRLALEFSWEEKPYFAYKLMKGKLPQGCHAYASTPDRLGFWKHFIPNVKEIRCKAGEVDIYSNPEYEKKFKECRLEG